MRSVLPARDQGGGGAMTALDIVRAAMPGTTLEDVDFFVAYCGGFPALQFYVVPAKDVIGRSDIRLYPHRRKGCRPGGLNWEKCNNAFELLGSAE